MVVHTHHIIPKHMGGTDVPENLIKVTAEEHAELHFALYLEHGRWQDYRAAMGLAGLEGWKDTAGYGFRGRKHTLESRQKMSEKAKKPRSSRTFTPEHIEKLRAASKKHADKFQKMYGREIVIDGIVYPSVRQAARDLKCSTKKVYRLLRDG